MNREEIMLTIFSLLLSMIFIFGASNLYADNEFFTSSGQSEIIAAISSFYFSISIRLIPGGLHDTYNRSAQANFVMIIKFAFSAEKFRSRHKKLFILSDIFFAASMLMGFAAIVSFFNGT
jgi:hypothetical protein